MNDLLRARSELNGGYLLRSQILDCGYTDRDIRAGVKVGVIVRIRTGTYAFADAHLKLDESARHRVVAYSVIDKLGPNVALSHASACADHGLAQFDADLGTVHVTRLDGGAGRKESGTTHHVGEVVRDHDLVERDGRLVIRPSRAVWEASTSTSQRGALVVMDSALHHRVVTRHELYGTARQHGQWRGARRAGISLRFADGDAETPGESLTRFLCFEQGLPKPTLQHRVRDEAGVVVARTDLAWLAYRHLGEFDGLVKYLRLFRDGETPADVVIREKRREDLTRRQSLGMSRFVWSQVLPGSARATGLMLKHDLEQSRRLYLHNRTVIAL